MAFRPLFLPVVLVASGSLAVKLANAALPAGWRGSR